MRRGAKAPDVNLGSTARQVATELRLVVRRRDTYQAAEQLYANAFALGLFARGSPPLPDHLDPAKSWETARDEFDKARGAFEQAIRVELGAREIHVDIPFAVIATQGDRR